MAWRDTWTPELWETALGMATAGDSLAAIAGVAGCSKDAVRRKFYRKGVASVEMAARKTVNIWIDRNTYRALNESALARGKSVETMLADVAELMSDPVLLENVLDDGVSI